MTNVRMPIALNSISRELVHVDDAENGKKCNCICFSCESPLIAYNGGELKEHSFGHYPNNNCEARYESFIHWITKELIKKRSRIKLPAIRGFDLNIDTNIIRQNLKSKFGKLSEQINLERISKMTVLQNEMYIDIEHCQIEKTILIEGQTVRIDICLTSNSRDLFIEPFFSNPINSKKKEILKMIDVSVIAISLRKFYELNTHFFKIDKLEKYIFDETNGKEWIILSSTKLNQLIKIYYSKINDAINKIDLSIIETFQINIRNLEEELNKLNEMELAAMNQLQKIHSGISKLRSKIKNERVNQINLIEKQLIR